MPLKPRIFSKIIYNTQQARPNPGKFWVVLSASVGHVTGTTTYLRFFDPKTAGTTLFAVIDTDLNTGYYPAGIVRTVTSGAVTYLLQVPCQVQGVKLTNECYIDFAADAVAFAILVFEEFDCSEGSSK